MKRKNKFMVRMKPCFKASELEREIKNLYGHIIPVPISVFGEDAIANTYMEYWPDDTPLTGGNLALINSVIRNWAPFGESVLIKIDTI